MSRSLTSEKCTEPRRRRASWSIGSAVLVAASCGGEAVPPPTSDEPGEDPAVVEPIDCFGEGVESAEVVVNGRGLFVALGASAVRPSTDLYHRENAAWTRLHPASSGELPGLSTLPNGTLLRFGSSGTCSVELVPPDEPAGCNGAPEVSSVFVVRDDLAYAAASLGSVLVFDGRHWTELFTGHVGEEGYNYVYDVWADEETLVLTTTHGVFVGTPGEALSRLPDRPGLRDAYLSDVWATGAEDIWVVANVLESDGYGGHLLHYQAGAWTEVWPGADAEPPAGCTWAPRVQGIWGAAGEVFFFTSSGVHRYRDGAVETFFDADCDQNVRVLDLWGVSPTEVYVTVQVLRSEADCAAVEVLRFDGTTWGPLD